MPIFYRQPDKPLPRVEGIKNGSQSALDGGFDCSNASILSDCLHRYQRSVQSYHFTMKSIETKIFAENISNIFGVE